MLHRTGDDGITRGLPPRFVAAVKSGDGTFQETIPHATMLFTDIVGYTSLSGTMAADEVTGMLNRLFEVFDKHAEDLGLVCVDVIGDCYMTVCGLNDETPAEQAAKIAKVRTDSKKTAIRTKCPPLPPSP